MHRLGLITEGTVMTDMESLPEFHSPDETNLIQMGCSPN